jgi:hypothetical protein
LDSTAAQRVENLHFADRSTSDEALLLLSEEKIEVARDVSVGEGGSVAVWGV